MNQKENNYYNMQILWLKKGFDLLSTFISVLKKRCLEKFKKLKK